MMARPKMCGKMTWHCANVAGDNHEPPRSSAQRRISGSSTANGRSGSSPTHVISSGRVRLTFDRSQGSPERSPQVLIEHVTQCHRLNSVGVDRLRVACRPRASFSARIKLGCVLAVASESINLDLVLA